MARRPEALDRLDHRRTQVHEENPSRDSQVSLILRTYASRSNGRTTSKVTLRLCLLLARHPVPAFTPSTSANARAWTQFSAHRWRRETNTRQELRFESSTKISTWSWRLLLGTSNQCPEQKPLIGLMAFRSSSTDWTRCCRSLFGVSLSTRCPAVSSLTKEPHSSLKPRSRSYRSCLVEQTKERSRN